MFWHSKSYTFVDVIDVATEPLENLVSLIQKLSIQNFSEYVFKIKYVEDVCTQKPVLFLFCQKD